MMMGVFERLSEMGVQRKSGEGSEGEGKVISEEGDQRGRGSERKGKDERGSMVIRDLQFRLQADFGTDLFCSGYQENPSLQSLVQEKLHNGQLIYHKVRSPYTNIPGSI